MAPMSDARRRRPAGGPAVLALVLVLVAAAALAASAWPRPGVRVHRDLDGGAPAGIDVYAPARGHGLPVLVLLHGCCGSKADLSQLALATAANGAVVFNTGWRNMADGGRFPGVYQQAACAVRAARTSARRYGGDPRRVTLLGWSDGALLAGVVANAGDDFGGGCRAAGGSALPDAVVGVGGFFGWPVDRDTVPDRYVTPRTIGFFGGAPTRRPAAWAAGNPYSHLGRNHRLAVTLLVASGDPLLEDNRRFLAALTGAGHRATLTVVPGGDALTLISPRTDQGRVTVREALRVAGGA
jgi:acetyl esterase/lipase